MSDMSKLPMDAIVACDAEVERLRARVAELEEGIKDLRDVSDGDGLLLTQRSKERDRWKAEAMAARTCLMHGNRGQPIETYEAWKAARAANHA